MSKRDAARTVQLGLVFLLLSLSVIPAAAAQRRSSDPAGEFIEPAKEAFIAILGIFSLDWMDNDAASYQAFARVVIFIVMWVLIREVLGRLGHLSPKSVNVIAFAIALMGTVFMPSNWLTGIGVSYAAIFTMIPILFIAYMGFRVARTTDTSHASGRLGFIFVYIILFALLVFIASHMLHTSTNQRIFDVSMDVIIWVMYAITAIYLVLNLFTKGFGAGGGYSGGGFGEEKGGRKEKDKGQAVKSSEKARGLLERAGAARDGLRQWAHQQVRSLTKISGTVEIDLQEIKVIVDELITISNDVLAKQGRGEIKYFDMNATAFKKAFADVRANMRNLKKHLTIHQRTIRSYQRVLGGQQGLLRSAMKSDKSAYKVLEAKGGKLKEYLLGNEITNPAARSTLKKLDDEAGRLLKENEANSQRYREALVRERWTLRRLIRVLSRVQGEFDKAEKCLNEKHLSADNVREAVQHFLQMKTFYAELKEDEKVELTFAVKKEMFERKQEEIEAHCIQIDDGMENLLTES